MSKAIRILNVTIACLLAVTAAAASTIRLEFRVEPEETLPGVPVAFRLRAINTGSAPAALPFMVRLESRIEPEGWTAICYSISFHDDCGAEIPVQPENASLELAPGEERVLDYLPGPTSPPWAHHRDLLTPGTYRLRLVSAGIGVEKIASNEVVLTILTPTGEDAAAWKLMGGTPYHIAAFAERLWDLYPNSVYTTMTPPRVPRENDWNDHIDVYTEALTRNPLSRFADNFKFGIARAHFELGNDAIRQFDLQKTVRHLEASYALLQELAGKETEAGLKAEVTKSLENRLTHAQMEDFIERRRHGGPSRCVRWLAQTWRSELGRGEKIR